MVYRAKITRIFSKIESIYNFNKNHVVTDSKDAYIEVITEEEAEIIESMNNMQEQLDKLYIELIEKARK